MAASPVGYSPHKPTTKQQAFVDFDGQEALYGGAAGGGKSDALLMAALKYVNVPGYAALILRRSFSDLALDGAIMDRSKKWLLGTDAHWEATNMRWRFPSGATLTFGYLHDPGDELRYQSAEFQFIAFDELTQFPRAQYTYLFSRLRRAGVAAPLRMRGATNPGGPGHDWVRERWGIPDDVEMGKVYTTDAGRVFYPAKLDDNPHVDRQSYELALAELEFVTRAQLRDGSWRRDSSTLVYGFDADRDLVADLPQLPAGMTWMSVLGIDYGNVNATALVVLRFCPDFTETVFVAESQKWAGLDPTAAAVIVEAWSKRFGGFVRMVGDVGGLGKGYAEEAINRWALPIEPAAKANKYGYIKLLNGAYENSKIRIVKATNKDLIDELAKHPWKDGKQYLEEQPGSANHCADAHLYGWREAIGWAHKASGPPPPKVGTPEHFAALAEEMRVQHEAEMARDPFERDPWARE